jgi:nucleotide-binding universal stress UspA family protein
MAVIEKILFPVDFSPACVAFMPYVRRAATLLGAKVSLIHVVDPASYSGLELYTRSPFDIAEEHLSIGRKRLDSFLAAEFPAGEYARILASGDAATQIARVARDEKFGLIMLPTHAGLFRQMLLGSTTAKVLNDAECPVMTSRHAQTMAPRPLEHREWLCAVGLSANSEKVLRFAKNAAASAQAKLVIIHAVQAGGSNPSVQLDLEEQIESAEREEARQSIAALQQTVGIDVPVRVAIGSVKEALLEAARRSDADVLIIGRSSRPGAHGRLRDLTYAMVRDSPFPVLTI